MTSPDHPSAAPAENQIKHDFENPFTERLEPLHLTVFKIVALTLLLGAAPRLNGAIFTTNQLIGYLCYPVSLAFSGTVLLMIREQMRGLIPRLCRSLAASSGWFTPYETTLARQGWRVMLSALLLSAAAVFGWHSALYFFAVPYVTIYHILRFWAQVKDRDRHYIAAAAQYLDPLGKAPAIESEQDHDHHVSSF
ncbi:MAG: hypothetical protein NTZ90_12995 [Proteobacteria bacterium]|nr:hypothetical protein [Pseudomonadota bacterium]